MRDISNAAIRNAVQVENAYVRSWYLFFVNQYCDRDDYRYYDDRDGNDYRYYEDRDDYDAIDDIDNRDDRDDCSDDDYTDEADDNDAVLYWSILVL